jgi:GT2 family glycosyltransferase
MPGHFLSILISTRNRCSALKRCLDSIFAQDFPKDRLSLWVLDDAGTDETARDIPALFNEMKDKGWDRLTFLHSTENMHIVAARHKLESLAVPQSDLVLVMDDDAVLAPGALSAMTAYIDSHPDVGALGPKISQWQDPRVVCHRPNFVNGWTARYTEMETDQTTECDWLINACVMFRAKALVESAGLDPRFYTCHEEVDLCLRLKSLGYKIVYFPSVEAFHEIDLGQPKPERFYYLHRNKLLVIKKNFHGVQRLTALCIAYGISPFKALYEAAKHKDPSLMADHLKAVAQAYCDAAFNRWGKKRP